jgi:S1-C subfamily serine protease
VGKEVCQVVQHCTPIVGGFSGAPLMNTDGEVIGVVTYSTFRIFEARELSTDARPTLNQGTSRILDPAHVSFAVSATHVSQVIERRQQKLDNGHDFATAPSP